MEFSQQLIQQRKVRGLSQSELAGKVGVSRQAVSKWETGEAAPDLSKLLALANALDISLDQLCGREVSAVPPETAVPPPAAPARLRSVWRLVLLAVVLLAAGFLLGRWSVHSAAALPDTISVSGVNFAPGDTGSVRFFCTPSIASDALIYQVTFTSDDGRFEMDFQPVLDRAACTSVGVLKSDQHQVFGRFTGRAVLDDGTAVELRNFMGFAERVENKW